MTREEADTTSPPTAAGDIQPWASQPLADKIIVITGASSGLGATMAETVTRAGASVVVAARRLDRLLALADRLPRAEAVQADVSRSADRQHLIDAVLEMHGRIDGLINNAGVSLTGPALRQDAAAFAQVLEVNLVAPFELSCLAATAMRSNESGGAIVNIASVMALRSVDALPDAAYVASKAGLAGLTRELASQWGRHGIRVNALAPGFFESEMTQGLFSSDAAPEWLVGGTPLGRVGTSGELDEPLVLLLGEGGAFITGQTLVVDGGLATR